MRWTDHVVVTHENTAPLTSPRDGRYFLVNVLRRGELTIKAKSKVQKNAPTKPSTVFFGLSLIRGVLPNSLPGTIFPGTL